MDPVTKEVAIPGLIDGNPFEVEKRVIKDLNALTDELAEYIDEATKQLANAERSRILNDEGVSITGEELADLYADSLRAGTLVRMTGAAKALVGAVSEL